MKKVIKILGIIIILVTVIILFYWFGIRKMIAKSDFKKTINAMSTGDYSDQFYYVDMNGLVKDDLSLNFVGYLLLQKTEFIDPKYEWSNRSADITVTVKYPNLFKVLDYKLKNEDKAYSSKEIESFLKEKLLRGEFGYSTEELHLTIVEDDGHWFLVENKELLNVYSGGLANYYSEILTATFKNNQASS